MLADLSPVPAIRKAALRFNQMTSERRTLKLVKECHRLLSVRADANSPAIALNIISELNELTEAEQDALFYALAQEFSPDPQAALAAAQAYAATPTANALAALSAAAEPPRQELFRRLNRAPGPSRPTCCTCSLRGSTPDFWRCAASTGTRPLTCWSKSFSTKPFTRSTAGTTCAVACNRTVAVSHFFMLSWLTFR